MMRDFNELNLNAGGEPVRRPPPSDADLAEFEGAIGMPLPAELKGLLLFSNGGRPELDSVEGGDRGFAVDHFYHLTAEDRGCESMWSGIEDWRPVLGDQAIPFAQTGGGSPFFLDVSESPPSVKMCVHDEEMRVIDIAPTFEAFIDGLAINPDMI